MIHFTEGKKQKIKTTCQRCGYEWIQSERQLYRDAEITFCRSCKATESKTVYFCGCKATAKQPLCDGSHK
jgi:CDGSH-type Zn-finger protein